MLASMIPMATRGFYRRYQAIKKAIGAASRADCFFNGLVHLSQRIAHHEHEIGRTFRHTTHQVGIPL